MSLLGFKKQFAGPVERREKRQTIRAKVHGHVVGRPIQLYTGLRTKACRKLAAEDPICMSIVPVVIAWGGYCKIDGTMLGGERLAEFAAAELRHRLGLTPYARAEFEWCYEPAIDDIDRAHKAIVLSFFGFGSDSVSRGCRTGFRAKMSDGRATPAQTWADYADTIPAFVNRMRGVVIESRPAAEILARYDTPETAFYVDPPYPHSTRSSLNGRSSKTHGYRHELDDGDHAALIDQLKSLCGMVVLSGYPFQPYDDALEGWLRVERSALADGAKERTEVLWINPRAADRLDTRKAQGSFFA